MDASWKASIAPLIACAAMVTTLVYAGRVLSVDEPGSRTFGPMTCPACGLSSPDVRDEETANALASQGILNNVRPGDRVMVCNDTLCVTYEMSSDSTWRGVAEEPQHTRGSSGSGTPSGGTASGPGIDPRWGNIDCWTCTGTVIVGPIKN